MGLERDVAKVAGVALTAAAALGAAAGWVVSRIATHLLYEGRSEHQR